MPTFKCSLTLHRNPPVFEHDDPGFHETITIDVTAHSLPEAVKTLCKHFRDISPKNIHIHVASLDGHTIREGWGTQS